MIVPVYKVEPYLTICLDSILCQTYENFELIAVDDGSPDNCGKICDEYACKDSRIKVIHQKNAGLSAARNVAIDVASGDYLTFVDSDDFAFPEYLDKMVKALELNNADMAVCGNIRCSSSDSPKSLKKNLGNDKNEIFSDDRMKVFFSSNKISTVAWGKLYKREIFENLRFPNGKYNEDIYTTYLAVDLASRIVVCDYVGYAYRQNENSIINESYSKRKWDSIEGSLIRAKYIREHYPDLKKFAEREIIYNCNRVLMSMARSKVRDVEVMGKMQELYRTYVFSYVLGDCSLAGKIFAVLSFLNVKLSFFFEKILQF